MFAEIIRVSHTILRRIKDPENNKMSIKLMAWYYILTQLSRLSIRKNVIGIPFKVNDSSHAPGRIAVIIHCYYPELLNEMADFLANIPYPYKLFVSTDTPEKQILIESILKSRNIENFETRLTTNRGRDIAPKYITFKDVYSGYDYFLHLHSKKSPHGGETWGNAWRRYLLQSVMGSPQIIHSTLALLKDPRVGLVFPYPFDPKLPWLRWSDSYEACVALAKKLALKIERDHCPEYPAGSMFWGKTSIVRPILDLNLKFEDFPVEAGQLDGGLNHAIERMIVPVANSLGLYGVTTTIPSRHVPKTIHIESEKELTGAINRCMAIDGFSKLARSQTLPILK